MQREDAVVLNEIGAKHMKQHGIPFWPGKRVQVVSKGPSGVLVSLPELSRPHMLPPDGVTEIKGFRGDIIDALHEVVQTHAEELRRVKFGDLAITIHEGLPAFVDIKTKHKLK